MKHILHDYQRCFLNYHELTPDAFQQVRIQSAAQIAPPSAYGMGGDSDDDDDVPAIPDLDDVQVCE